MVNSRAGAAWARVSEDLCFFSGAHGRDAEQVACLDAAVGLAAFFVQAHFAGADNAVDMAFGYAFEDFYQIVVKALSGFVLGDGNQAD